MFSQYSWWDFFKFILALAIPYYAYVIIKYYREDIREWISNRGEKTPTRTEDSDDNEEADEDTSTMYNAKTYTAPASQAIADTKPVVTSPAKAAAEYQKEADLAEAPIITAEQATPFDVSMPVQSTSHEELPLEEVIETAQKLAVDEKGVVTPSDPASEKESKLASVINQQNGFGAFGDIAFNR